MTRRAKATPQDIWLGEFIEREVTAARLAATGAAFEAAAKEAETFSGYAAQSDREVTLCSRMAEETAEAIRKLTPADAVSALDEVRRATRIEELKAVVRDQHPDGDIDRCCLDSCRKLRERLAALSAPAVPDGAAKGDGE